MTHERIHPDNTTDSNYLTDGGVMARWMMYDLFDLDTERVIADIVAEHVNLRGRLHPQIVDIGASNGSFLGLLGAELHHLKPELVAVEPNMGQHKPEYDKKIDQLIEQEIGRYIGLNIEYNPPKPSIRRIPERAEQALVKFEDKSIDIASCLFMLYHLSDEARASVYGSLKEKVTEDGLIVITTSGEGNKSGTRRVEEKTAELLGIQAPPHMNTGFTSEKADEELRGFFPEAEGYSIETIRQKKQLGIDDDNYKLLSYLTRLSVLSLADQFKPSQVKNNNFSHDVDHAIAQIVDHDYKETVDRSIYVIRRG